MTSWLQKSRSTFFQPLVWTQTITDPLSRESNDDIPLWWRHNDHDSVSNHQPHECLLNRLFRRRSKKTSKLRVTGLCVGNSPGPVNSPHKGPVTRKMFPFDDVIMPSQAESVSMAWRPNTHSLTTLKMANWSLVVPRVVIMPPVPPVTTNFRLSVFLEDNMTDTLLKSYLTELCS